MNKILSLWLAGNSIADIANKTGHDQSVVVDTIREMWGEL